MDRLLREAPTPWVTQVLAAACVRGSQAGFGPGFQDGVRATDRIPGNPPEWDWDRLQRLARRPGVQVAGWPLDAVESLLERSAPGSVWLFRWRLRILATAAGYTPEDGPRRRRVVRATLREEILRAGHVQGLSHFPARSGEPGAVVEPSMELARVAAALDVLLPVGTGERPLAAPVTGAELLLESPVARWAPLLRLAFGPVDSTVGDPPAGVLTGAWTGPVLDLFRPLLTDPVAVQALVTLTAGTGGPHRDELDDADDRVYAAATSSGGYGWAPLWDTAGVGFTGTAAELLSTVTAITSPVGEPAG